MVQSIILILILALVIAALSVKPIRKTIGLLLVILGTIACLTFIGIVIGVPAIIVGGLFLFI